MVYNVLPLWSPPGQAAPFSSRYQWPKHGSYEELVSDPANALGALAGKAHLKYVEVKAVVGGVTAIQGSAKMAYPYEGWLVRNVEYETFKTGKKTVYRVVGHPEDLTSVTAAAAAVVAERTGSSGH
jgi:5-methylthioadenosine/S-adenosylhomocysteine deaminase